MEKKQYKCPYCEHVFNVSYAGIGKIKYVDRETGEIWFEYEVAEKTCPHCYEQFGVVQELEEVKTDERQKTEEKGGDSGEYRKAETKMEDLSVERG